MWIAACFSGGRLEIMRDVCVMRMRPIETPNSTKPAAASGAIQLERYSHNSRRTDQAKGLVCAGVAGAAARAAGDVPTSASMLMPPWLLSARNCRYPSPQQTDHRCWAYALRLTLKAAHGRH